MSEEKKNSVLIVDDEHTNIMALTHILSPCYTVYAVKDGQDAVECAEEYLPDIILLDILMPGMDGYTVLSALKGSHKTRDIPVIFVTGLGGTGDEEKGLSLGAADYISKPFSPVIVKLRVNNQIKIIEQTRLIIEKETDARSSRARREFLSRMSHEMRTPMNAIMGMTALMKKTVENEKREDMLDKISNASEQLMKLIDNVLDMSDIEDNKLRLSCSYFSFADMIRQITDKADPAIKSKRQTLTTYIDPTIPDFITSDRKRLTQVIMDLLDNAGKFTPEQGSIRLNAFFCGVEDETLTLRIEVIDNGMGISKEQCEKLFVPFEQGDGGIDRKFGGSGLGLAISQHIVGLMGGAIAVESEPGKGSKFFFDIKTSLTTPKAKDETPVMLKGKTALLVEDVEINREIVMAMLEDTGLQIVCAENGSEALELFTACPKKFDVILMDINMPGMDGAEATRRIRALDTPESMRVPIIAMTANVLTSEVETYFSAGMTGHIGKPMDPEKLLSTLNEYLNSL